MVLLNARAKILCGLWSLLGYNLRGSKTGFRIYSDGIRGWRPRQYDFINAAGVADIQDEISPLKALKIIPAEWGSRNMANAQAQYGAEEMLYSSTTLVSKPIII